MPKPRALAGLLLVGLLSTTAEGAVYTANVTLTFGDVSSDGLAPGTGAPIFGPSLCSTGTSTGCFSGNFDSTGDKVWSAQAPNNIDLSAGAASVLYDQSGNNGTSYYNPYSEFAGRQDYSAFGQPNCIASTVYFDFSCSQIVNGQFRIFPTVVSGVGPAATGAGTLAIDTTAGTITGSISVAPYVYRSGDSSPFTASAQYIGYYGGGATLSFNLTGSFSETSWTITGGTASFSDPKAACFPGDFSGTLCNASPVIGGQDPVNFSHLGFLDVPIWNALPSAGGVLQFILPGVIGSASLIDNGDGTGSISAAGGEFRRPLGSTSAGCAQQVVYNASTNSLTCGQISVGIWSMTGTLEGLTVQMIPVPAAVWLFGSALGLLGWVRRGLSES